MSKRAFRPISPLAARNFDAVGLKADFVSNISSAPTPESKASGWRNLRGTARRPITDASAMRDCARPRSSRREYAYRTAARIPPATAESVSPRPHAVRGTSLERYKALQKFSNAAVRSGLLTLARGMFPAQGAADEKRKTRAAEQVEAAKDMSIVCPGGNVSAAPDLARGAYHAGSSRDARTAASPTPAKAAQASDTLKPMPHGDSIGAGDQAVRRALRVTTEISSMPEGCRSRWHKAPSRRRRQLARPQGDVSSGGQTSTPGRSDFAKRRHNDIFRSRTWRQ